MSMAEADQVTLQSLFEGSRLNIPRYQRSYAWGTTEVDDLLGDIEYIIDRKKSVADNDNIIHYFGTIVLNDAGEVDSPVSDDWTLFDIVDGQQRITTVSLLVSVLNEELQDLDDYIDVDTSVQDPPSELGSNYRNIFVKYKTRDNGRRLTPDELTEEAYRRLAVDSQSPEIIDDTDILPERKLADAKEAIQDWLNQKKRSIADTDSFEQADEEDLYNYFEYIDEVISVVCSSFKVTKYKVEDAAEAGRLFEVVNDRGKDLNIADRIKSHLLYCAGEVEDIDAEHVAREFNDAVETVTQHGGDEDVIEQFVKDHWAMFTGEATRRRPQNEINELHRRIKKIDRYAPIDRDPDDLKDWIDEYVQSLQDSSQAFVEAYYPDLINERYTIDKKLLNKIYCIDNSGAATNFRPLLMAALLHFDVDSSEFSDIIRQCETFAFRGYQINGLRTNSLRRSLKEKAHELYISIEDTEDIRELFGEMTLDKVPSDPEEASDKIFHWFADEIQKKCSEEVFVESLKRPDVISGSQTHGWTGFHNRSTVRYLLYEYEHYLRERRGDTGTLNLVDFGTLNEDYEIEHIAPQNPNSEDDALENHEENKHRLGNLALLGPDDNKSIGNESYEEKYNQIYNYDEGSDLAILRELPEPSEAWSMDNVNQRTLDIVEFCRRRWSGGKVAKIYAEDEVKNENKGDIAEAVRGHFENTEPGYISAVFFVQDESPIAQETEDFISQNTCNNCTGVRLEISESGEFWCTCDHDVDHPNYQVIVDK